MEMKPRNVVSKVSVDGLINRLCVEASAPVGGLLGSLVSRAPIKKLHSAFKEFKRKGSEERKEICHDIRRSGRMLALSGGLEGVKTPLLDVYQDGIKRRSRVRGRRRAFGFCLKAASEVAGWCAPYGLGLTVASIASFLVNRAKVHNDRRDHRDMANVQRLPTVGESPGLKPVFNENGFAYWYDRENIAHIDHEYIVPIGAPQSGSSLAWIEPKFNAPLIAYLHTYIALRPRNRANLYALLNRARVWCKEKGLSEQITASLVPYCTAEAFKQSSSERAAVMVLNGASVQKAERDVKFLQQGKDGFIADCARALLPEAHEVQNFVLA